jgi:hypothetical protein
VERLGPDFYRVGDFTKRFFDREAVLEALNGWDIAFIEEATIDRYEQPKVIWEVMARSSG